MNNNMQIVPEYALVKERTVRTPNRRARGMVALLAASLALMTVIGPVTAASPQPVTIVSHVTFNDSGPNFGDFEATGSAVDSGVICERGTFVDTFIRFSGFQSGRDDVQIVVRKEFTCGDGSGTFFVQLRIYAHFDTGIESFTWVAHGGTGDYAELRGSGDGFTVPNYPPGNINTYMGFFLH